MSSLTQTFYRPLPSSWKAFTCSYPERLPYLRRTCISLGIFAPIGVRLPQQGWRLAVTLQDLANERGK